MAMEPSISLKQLQVTFILCLIMLGSATHLFLSQMGWDVTKHNKIVGGAEKFAVESF